MLATCPSQVGVARYGMARLSGVLVRWIIRWSVSMASEAKGIAELLADLRTWVAALEAAEAEREQAEEALQRAHTDLERRVQERTAALAASEARLRTLYEAVSGAVLVWNAAGELIEANEAAQQTFALTPAQMVGRRWEALWTVKDEDGA